ncbi:La-related protein 1 [Zancudomyces culisetae]|uniref:La-related protein 1 n=1 Tax=Zancudomyces culisetae TaxID=1213189 RepID=A0A1R1PUY1_ZANCU|nr:La-related protein 1 [Zancudomyces culisetae]|eukprot:OMH84756.1 La-related protein 1 [Zancudomyces culisetae]
MVEESSGNTQVNSSELAVPVNENTPRVWKQIDSKRVELEKEIASHENWPALKLEDQIGKLALGEKEESRKDRNKKSSGKKSYKDKTKWTTLIPELTYAPVKATNGTGQKKGTAGNRRNVNRGTTPTTASTSTSSAPTKDGNKDGSKSINSSTNGSTRIANTTATTTTTASTDENTTLNTSDISTSGTNTSSTDIATTADAYASTENSDAKNSSSLKEASRDAVSSTQLTNGRDKDATTYPAKNNSRNGNSTANYVRKGQPNRIQQSQLWSEGKDKQQINGRNTFNTSRNGQYIQQPQQQQNNRKKRYHYHQQRNPMMHGLHHQMLMPIPVQAPLPEPLPSSQDPELVKSFVKKQIEYYFSIENIVKDVYFRSKMDQDGYVNLPLISSFNRIRSLTTDLSLITDALMSSDILELDVAKQNVRLKNDWNRWVLPADPSSPTLQQ